jgi:hypothetical protein
MRLTRPCSSRVALAAAILLAALLGAQQSAAAQGPARAASLPRAYAGGASQTFSVRPHRIILSSAEGGLLTIHWSSWTNDEATGTGTSQPDHGETQIKVHLSDTSEGLFLHMTVSFRYHGRWVPEHLELAEMIGDSSFDEWAPPSWVHKTGESGLRAVT